MTGLDENEKKTAGVRGPCQNRAWFRFYEELNDYLPEAERKQSLAVGFGKNTSVRELIEEIGVPAGEIDRILVNGESVGFDHRLAGGERVSVYPVFESFDISPLIRLRDRPLRNSRFIVDQELSPLARLLCSRGFDSRRSDELSNEAILWIAVKEKRILLSRNPGLLADARLSHGFRIRARETRAQFQEVMARLQLSSDAAPS